jgi:hypothetical protein
MDDHIKIKIKQTNEDLFSTHFQRRNTFFTANMQINNFSEVEILV